MLRRGHLPAVRHNMFYVTQTSRPLPPANLLKVQNGRSDFRTREGQRAATKGEGSPLLEAIYPRLTHPIVLGDRARRGTHPLEDLKVLRQLFQRDLQHVLTPWLEPLQ